MLSTWNMLLMRFQLSPWSFDKRIILFNPLNPSDQISTMKFKRRFFGYYVLDLLSGWATQPVREGFGKVERGKGGSHGLADLVDNGCAKTFRL